MRKHFINDRGLYIWFSKILNFIKNIKNMIPLEKRRQLSYQFCFFNTREEKTYFVKKKNCQKKIHQKENFI